MSSSAASHPTLSFRLLVILLLAFSVLAGCGSSSDTAAPVPAANELRLTVDRGPGSGFNSPVASVTVCVPGTSDCRTIDRVLVDTGSFGLRLTASALGSALTLPAVSTAAGAAAECAHFADGYVWGSVRRADVQLSGEVAANLPIQVIGDPAAPYATVPTPCSNSGPDFGARLGANGILGVGLFNQDCPACAASAAPAVYFACTGGGCPAAPMPLALQVANPVPAFAADNNGVVVALPEVPAGGVTTLAGSLFFGIGTQPNNQLGSVTVYTTDSNGNFTTIYKGASLTSFLDTGSNAIFFNDPAIPQCLSFYCPASSLTLSAVNVSAGGVSGTVSFTVESTASLVSGVSAAHVGADAGMGRTFDWGLPFFFGRKVFVAISGASTSKGPGPYWAY
jgi:hypothetical protein